MKVFISLLGSKYQSLDLNCFKAQVEIIDKTYFLEITFLKFSSNIFSVQIVWEQKKKQFFPN